MYMLHVVATQLWRAIFKPQNSHLYCAWKLPLTMDASWAPMSPTSHIMPYFIIYTINNHMAFILSMLAAATHLWRTILKRAKLNFCCKWSLHQSNRSPWAPHALVHLFSPHMVMEYLSQVYLLLKMEVMETFMSFKLMVYCCTLFFKSMPFSHAPWPTLICECIFSIKTLPMEGFLTLNF